jgi:hypothetical protein
MQEYAKYYALILYDKQKTTVQGPGLHILHTILRNIQNIHNTQTVHPLVVCAKFCVSICKKTTANNSANSVFCIFCIFCTFEMCNLNVQPESMQIVHNLNYMEQ